MSRIESMAGEPVVENPPGRPLTLEDVIGSPAEVPEILDRTKRPDDFVNIARRIAANVDNLFGPVGGLRETVLDTEEKRQKYQEDEIYRRIVDNQIQGVTERAYQEAAARGHRPARTEAERTQEDEILKQQYKMSQETIDKERTEGNEIVWVLLQGMYERPVWFPTNEKRAEEKIRTILADYEDSGDGNVAKFNENAMQEMQYLIYAFVRDPRYADKTLEDQGNFKYNRNEFGKEMANEFVVRTSFLSTFAPYFNCTKADEVSPILINLTDHQLNYFHEQALRKGLPIGETIKYFDRHATEYMKARGKTLNGYRAQARLAMLKGLEDKGLFPSAGDASDERKYWEKKAQDDLRYADKITDPTPDQIEQKIADLNADTRGAILIGERVWRTLQRATTKEALFNISTGRDLDDEINAQEAFLRDKHPEWNDDRITLELEAFFKPRLETFTLYDFRSGALGGDFPGRKGAMKHPKLPHLYNMWVYARTGNERFHLSTMDNVDLQFRDGYTWFADRLEKTFAGELTDAIHELMKRDPANFDLFRSYVDANFQDPKTRPNLNNAPREIARKWAQTIMEGITGQKKNFKGLDGKDTWPPILDLQKIRFNGRINELADPTKMPTDDPNTDFIPEIKAVLNDSLMQKLMDALTPGGALYSPLRFWWDWSQQNRYAMKLYENKAYGGPLAANKQFYEADDAYGRFPTDPNLDKAIPTLSYLSENRFDKQVIQQIIKNNVKLKTSQEGKDFFGYKYTKAGVDTTIEHFALKYQLSRPETKRLAKEILGTGPGYELAMLLSYFRPGSTLGIILYFMLDGIVRAGLGMKARQG